MPRTTGIEFHRAVAERNLNLPFILYTGRGSAEVASDAIGAGVTDYLQKEVGTNDYTLLANRIVHAVDSYRRDERLEFLETLLRWMQRLEDFERLILPNVSELPPEAEAVQEIR